MNTDLMFSSKTDLWSTPQDLFDKLNEEFQFQMDVCATHDNHKCDRYMTPEEDALSDNMEPHWIGKLWMNPPYGREISRWVKRAYESSIKYKATIVCLVPARTDTSWWHDYCIKGKVRFIRGRLKFNGHKNSAPFPSAIVIFSPNPPEGPPMPSELSLEQRAAKRYSTLYCDADTAPNLCMAIEMLRDALLQSPCNCLYRPVSGKREREIILCRRCEALAKTEM